MQAPVDNAPAEDLIRVENLSKHFSISAGMFAKPLQLKALQQAVLTMDLTNLAINFTYDAHYQLSVYADCKPCPPRYICSFTSETPRCSWPPVEQQAQYGSMCESCCRCQPKQMPYWLTVDEEVPPYKDNKHIVLQTTITALRDIELIVALELVHGMYYGDMDRDLRSVGDLFIHTPYRASYTPDDLMNRRSFIVILQQQDFADVSLPYNLPNTLQRVFGASNLMETVFEDDILIDRVAEIIVGDPTYELRRAGLADAEGNPISSSSRRLHEAPTQRQHVGYVRTHFIYSDRMLDAFRDVRTSARSQ
jgi:hypothetical protein